MTRDGRRECFCVWIVTDGKRTKYAALCESQATAFARSYNGFVAEDSVRVWVEQKTAYFAVNDRSQPATES
jgi:hypothetical protein